MGSVVVIAKVSVGSPGASTLRLSSTYKDYKAQFGRGTKKRTVWTLVAKPPSLGVHGLSNVDSVK